jgi:hypothetical protein
MQQRISAGARDLLTISKKFPDLAIVALAQMTQASTLRKKNAHFALLGLMGVA